MRDSNDQCTQFVVDFLIGLGWMELNMAEVGFGGEGSFVDKLGICRVVAQEECNNLFL